MAKSQPLSLQRQASALEKARSLAPEKARPLPCKKPFHCLCKEQASTLEKNPKQIQSSKRGGFGKGSQVVFEKAEARALPVSLCL